MGSTVKNLIVFISAIFAGGIVIYLLEILIHMVLPITIDVTSKDPQSTETFIRHTSTGNLALVLLAHAVGTLASGWVIRRFAVASHHVLALLLGLLWTITFVANLVSIPHPIWFSIADASIALPMTLLGMKLAQKDIF